MPPCTSASTRVGSPLADRWSDEGELLARENMDPQQAEAQARRELAAAAAEGRAAVAVEGRTNGSQAREDHGENEPEQAEPEPEPAHEPGYLSLIRQSATATGALLAVQRRLSFAWACTMPSTGREEALLCDNDVAAEVGTRIVYVAPTRTESLDYVDPQLELPRRLPAGFGPMPGGGFGGLITGGDYDRFPQPGPLHPFGPGSFGPGGFGGRGPVGGDHDIMPGGGLPDPGRAGAVPRPVPGPGWAAGQLGQFQPMGLELPLPVENQHARTTSRRAFPGYTVMLSNPNLRPEQRTALEKMEARRMERGE